MRNAWERQPGESSQAYEAFLAYRDLGRGRTVLAAYQQTKGRPAAAQPGGDWNSWSSKNAWLERAMAWDDHLQRERDKVAAREAREWEIRRRKHIKDVYFLAQKIKDKAKLMLDFPLARRELSDDGRTTITPAKWNVRTALEAARLGVEMEAAVIAAMSKPIVKCTNVDFDAIIGAADSDPSSGAEDAG